MALKKKMNPKSLPIAKNFGHKPTVGQQLMGISDLEEHDRPRKKKKRR